MLETDREGRVLVVRVDNPPHNLMNREMVAELDRLTRSLRGDRSVGAVIITGKRDGQFITHYDVAEILAGSERVGVSPGPRASGALLRVAGAIRRVPGLRALAARTPARGLLELYRLHDALLRMNRLDKVFVAAINGPATGGGCELSLACDLRYMARAGFPIGLPEMTVGFNPGGGGTQRLPRLVGTGRALEMMLEGRTLLPEEAKAVGLVDRVVEPEGLFDAAMETATRLARRSPEAIAGLKHATYEGTGRPLRRGLAVERKWFLAGAGTEESRRLMAAYAEQVRRDDVPAWAGRETIRAWQEGTAADREG